MKKYLLFIFIICLSLSLCACAKESTDPLAYQSYPFYVEGTLTFDETDYDFSLSMESESSSTITFSSPIPCAISFSALHPRVRLFLMRI